MTRHVHAYVVPAARLSFAIRVYVVIFTYVQDPRGRSPSWIHAQFSRVRDINQTPNGVPASGEMYYVCV